MKLAFRILSMIGCLLAACAPQTPAQVGEGAKSLGERNEMRRQRPDYKDIERIRFLTDNDYPPFNYYDEEGALTGFNVDMARAICEELFVECEILTVDWEGIVPALKRGEANAVIASIRPNKKTIEDLDFTQSYYRTPAQFAVRSGEYFDLTPSGLRDKKISVVKGSAHEVFLRDFFFSAKIVPQKRAVQSMLVLKQGAVDLTFGDGISLMFWINGIASERCCEFIGGPYLESKYFGEGVGIAVKRGDHKMRELLDYGLERVRQSGRYEELLLRYFPLAVL